MSKRRILGLFFIFLILIPFQVSALILDSDRDFMPDSWEIGYGLNPYDKSDADSDTDIDGYSNFQEYCADTNPTVGSSNPGTLSAANLILRGRALLTNKELVSANTAFKLALDADSADEEANFIYAVTRLLALIETNKEGPDTGKMDSIKELLDRAGVTPGGRTLYNWDADYQRDVNGHVILPPTAPTGGELQEFVLDYIMPEIDGSLNNLSFIGASFQTTVSPELFGEVETITNPVDDIEIDYGDVALFKSALNFIKMKLYLNTAYNNDIDIDELSNLIKFDMNQMLDDYPDMLTIERPANFNESKTSFNEAIDRYLEASEFIRSESDDQLDDLVTIDPIDLPDEADYRVTLGEIKQSVIQETDIRVDRDNFRDLTCDNITLDLTKLFDDPIIFRDYLPEFNGDKIIPWSMPDPSMGGMVPNISQEDWSIFFYDGFNDVVEPGDVRYSEIVVDGVDTDWAGHMPMQVDMCGDTGRASVELNSSDISGTYAAYNDSSFFLKMDFLGFIDTSYQIANPGDPIYYTYFLDMDLNDYYEVMVYVYYDTSGSVWKIGSNIPAVETLGVAAIGSNFIEISIPLSVLGDTREFSIKSEIFSKYILSSGLDETEWAPAVITGLVAYYPFNLNADDESGNVHDGTVYGAALSSDRSGNADAAYSFDGVDDYIEVPDSDDWAFGSTNFSIANWVYFPTGTLPGELEWFSVVGQYEDVSNRWDFGVYNSTALGGLGVYFFERQAGTNVIYSHINHVFEEGTWYHLTVTRDVNAWSYYVNGNLIGSEDETDVIPDLGVPLNIAKRMNNDGSLTFFDGVLDEIRIYDHALSIGEIQGLFNGDTDLDGLPDSWEMDNFGNLGQGPDDDPDSDGYTNLEEYQNRTDPTVDQQYQHQALVDLYNSTDGANWTINTNWMGAPGTECTWYGVMCDINNHITSLNLRENNLAGPIPSSIGSLPNLTYLDLAGNQLSGIIPIELGSLSNLTYLDLASNQLSGSIPVTLGSLSNLTYLDLASNQLLNSIPGELGNLSNLTNLYLNNNQLTGGIPVELASLSSLISLYLYDNQLSGTDAYSFTRRTFNKPGVVDGQYLFFQVYVEDSGGVPGNIESVTAANVNLQTDPRTYNIDQYSSDGFYYKFIPYSGQSGTYRITVTNYDGKTTKFDTLPVDLPRDLGVITCSIPDYDTTTPTVNCDAVTDADYYRGQAYTYNPVSNKLTEILDSGNQVSPDITVPAGYLNFGTSYIFRMQARDHNSSDELENRSELYMGFTPGKSVTIMHVSSFTETMANHPDSLRNGYKLHLKAIVDDLGGVPTNIDTVTAVNLDSDTYDLLHISGSHAYSLHPDYTRRDGTYHFTVTNNVPQTAEADALTIHIQTELGVIQNLSVSDMTTTPVFSFDPLAGADNYSVSVFDSSNTKIYQSDKYGTTSFDIPAGVMTEGNTYYLRAEAFDRNNSDGDGYNEVENASFNYMTFIAGGGSITGTSSYSGSQTGVRYIVAFTSMPSCTGPNTESPVYKTIAAPDGSFTLQYLPYGTYYIASVIYTCGEDCDMLPTDPWGIYGTCGDMTEVDIINGNVVTIGNIDLVDGTAQNPNPFYVATGVLFADYLPLDNSIRVYATTVGDDAVEEENTYINKVIGTEMINGTETMKTGVFPNAQMGNPDTFDEFYNWTKDGTEVQIWGNETFVCDTPVPIYPGLLMDGDIIFSGGPYDCTDRATSSPVVISGDDPRLVDIRDVTISGVTYPDALVIFSVDPETAVVPINFGINTLGFPAFYEPNANEPLPGGLTHFKIYARGVGPVADGDILTSTGEFGALIEMSSFIADDVLVGTWGAAEIRHSSGSWSANVWKITYNSDGTGSTFYRIGDGGVLQEITENFTYSAAKNTDGSIDCAMDFGSGVEIHRFVISDDGSMMIVNTPLDSSRQKMVIAIRMDTVKTHTESDLDGDYFGMGYNYDPVGTSWPGYYIAWSADTFFDGVDSYSFENTFNADGTVTTFNDTDAYSVLSDGTIMINSTVENGYISGNGKLGLFSSPVLDNPDWEMGFFMKAGDKVYSASDIGGTWAYVAIGDENNGSMIKAELGTIRCSSNGYCAVGLRTNQDDGSITYNSVGDTGISSVTFDGSIAYDTIPYAGAVGNNGMTFIYNGRSFDQSDLEDRAIVIGIKCSDCFNLSQEKIRMAGLNSDGCSDFRLNLNLYDLNSDNLQTVKDS